MDGQSGPREVRASWARALWGSGARRLIAGDAAVLILFTSLSAAAFLNSGRAGGPPSVIRVEVGGDLALTVDRLEKGRHVVRGPLGPSEIEVRRGEARILSSPCPLKLCIRAGWIGSPGEMVVCLPNEVVVRLPGAPGRGIDAVSR